jgi:hypothetical protein
MPMTGESGTAAAKLDAVLLRISDQDRQEFVDQLTRHCADGRLSFEELDERIAKAWAARTQADLRPLSADLPALAPLKGKEPDLKSWLADGKALLTAVPARMLVAGAAGLVLVFMLLALLAVPFGGDGGFHR